jgi:hypothetical protein
VLGPDARCQLGQGVRFGEGGFHATPFAPSTCKSCRGRKC